MGKEEAGDKLGHGSRIYLESFIHSAVCLTTGP
jgi:hypothetical protein